MNQTMLLGPFMAAHAKRQYEAPVKLNAAAQAAQEAHRQHALRLLKRMKRIERELHKEQDQWVAAVEAAHPELKDRQWRIYIGDADRPNPSSEWTYELEVAPEQPPKIEQPEWARELEKVLSGGEAA